MWNPGSCIFHYEGAGNVSSRSQQTVIRKTKMADREGVYRPQHISWEWLPRFLFRTKLCRRMGSTIPCRRIFRAWPRGTIFLGNLVWRPVSVFPARRLYIQPCHSYLIPPLPRQGVTRGIIWNPMWRPVSVLPARRWHRVFWESRVAACFSITCQVVINLTVS